MKKLLTVCLCVLALITVITAVRGQQRAGAVDTLLNRAYKTLKDSAAAPGAIITAKQFRVQLVRWLKKPVTFSNSLPLLEKSITITQTGDKKVKFYSWDEMGGGSWHNIQCVAQFRGADGRMAVQFLNTGREMETGGYTDSDIFKVHTIRQNGVSSYLTFAWGTHGGGNQHVIFRLFRLQGGRLLTVRAFTGRAKELVVEYRRTDTLNAVYNPVSRTLSYNEFKFSDDGTPWKKRTGKRIRLQFVRGRFR